MAYMNGYICFPIWIDKLLCMAYKDTADNGREYIYIDINPDSATDAIFGKVDSSKGFTSIESLEKYLITYLNRLKREIISNVKNYKEQKKCEKVTTKLAR